MGHISKALENTLKSNVIEPKPTFKKTYQRRDKVIISIDAKQSILHIMANTKETSVRYTFNNKTTNFKVRKSRSFNRLNNLSTLQCNYCKSEAIYIGIVNFKDNIHSFRYLTKDGVPLTVDHIKPLSLGGKDKQQNYQVLCSECNTKKGMLSDIDYRLMKNLIPDFKPFSFFEKCVFTIFSKIFKLT